MKSNVSTVDFKPSLSLTWSLPALAGVSADLCWAAGAAPRACTLLRDIFACLSMVYSTIELSLTYSGSSVARLERRMLYPASMSSTFQLICCLIHSSSCAACCDGVAPSVVIMISAKFMYLVRIPLCEVKDHSSLASSISSNFAARATHCSSG